MKNVTEPDTQLVDAFVALADTLVEDFDTVDFLSALTERIVDLGFASEAGILLADENDDLQFIAASHERTHLLELFQAQNQEGPCQDCYTTGMAVGVNDLALEMERWPLFAPQALTTGFRSVQAVPLRLRGTILGALNLFLEEPGGIRPATLSIVQALADVATIGIIQHRELHRAHTVEAQLQHALHSRISIEQAKGIVSEQTNLDMDGAFDVLRKHARSNNLKLGDVARDVVDGQLRAADLSPA